MPEGSAKECSPLWREPQVLPAYIAAASLILLLSRPLFFVIHKKNIKATVEPARSSNSRNLEQNNRNGFSKHVDNHGGSIIFTFQAVRAVLAAALLVVSTVRLAGVHGPKQVNLIQCITFVYATFLAIFVIIAAGSWSRAAASHLTLITLVAFTVYAIRDIWPLVTYERSPVDGVEGRILWAKIAFLAALGVVLPLIEPRQYVPQDPKNPTEPHPEQTASILSHATFTYLQPIISLAYRVPHLPFDLLPPLADYDHARVLVSSASKHLDSFNGAPKRHLFFGLLRTFYRDYAVMAVMLTIRMLAMLLAPYALNGLLLSLASRDDNSSGTRPWFWITCIFLGPCIAVISQQWQILVSTTALSRAQAILTQLLFNHALRISVSSQASNVGKSKQPGSSMSANLTGRLNNLVSTDINNIVGGREFLQLFYFCPAQCALCIFYLYTLLGWSTFVGMVIMLLCWPAPGYIAKKMQDYRKQSMKSTDARVQAATETLGVLRMIKLFAWEGKMSDRLAQKRDGELSWILPVQLLNLSSEVVSYCVTILQLAATYAVFSLVMKRQLTPAIIFSSMAVFDLLRDQLRLAAMLLPTIVDAKVSLDRVTEFFQHAELLDIYVNKSAIINVEADRHAPDAIGFKDARFTWSREDKNDGSATPTDRRFSLRIEGEVVFKRGAVNLVIGPTGCGKTSLLMALLGEMYYSHERSGSWYNLPRESGVAYAAQESWVLNETIKDNILFGATYDDERYNKVLYQCNLLPDLELFEAGDLTEVGEKGLTLSGGQKARVTLARAIYSTASILLLDDVLAALDVHTARWIVDKCFKSDLVRGRTVILVTHNVALTRSIADFVVSLGSDGHVTSRGSVSDALAMDVTLAHEVEEEVQIIEKSEVVGDAEKPVAPTKGKPSGKLVMAEEVAEGHVSWSALSMYLSALGGPRALLFWLVFVGGLFVGDIFRVLQTYWLGQWSEQYELRPVDQVNVAYYLGIFVAFLFGYIIAYTAAAFGYVSGIVRAARQLHKALMDAILGTTLRFLDSTPMSRIIARCTQDIRAIDGPVAFEFRFVVEILVTMIVKLTSIVIYTPIFLVPGALFFAAGAYTGNVYMAAQLSVKREMSNKKAPVLGHFGAAVSGLVSIRAYGAQEGFKTESYRRIDEYTRAARTFYDLNRWVGIRIDGLAGLFTAVLAAYMIYGPGHEHVLPSDVGFSLNMAVGFSGLIIWLVRFVNAFEVSGNSLERIRAFTIIEQEPKPVVDKVPPAAWPTSGNLRVERLHARYSMGGPLVLKDLSFEVKSGERVGIVGRTGSGKSSLTLSLLRAIPTDGHIFYDGVDTSATNLDALRSNITIIPQVPEMLSGTLRENLDPFNEHDDATLNGALRSAGLTALQGADDEGKITLDTPIAASGGNLSVGQRQILALARALVRGSKLLILDEATSSIDYKTDTIIQKSLRTELGGDVTLLIVAHRLQTIMDADKVMVLDAGRIVEFDAPRVLLARSGGYFKALVDESADKEALYAVAYGSAVSS
ncbi:P-loop containing nucleoside triphosphate hydrolase protein [Peniophora sp. CONT]|nr:P-loop containing nucleoside triphosphate hydrolase protein [Peniophora sp. CONT]